MHVSHQAIPTLDSHCHRNIFNIIMVGSVILVEQKRFIKMLKYAFTFVVMIATSNIVCKSSNHHLRDRQHITKAIHIWFVLRV